MREYVKLSSGHMEFIIRALDGDPGSVKAPALPALPERPSEALVQEATAWLKSQSYPIEPRLAWPDGGLPTYDWTGKIEENLRAQPGQALCVWGDASWGQLVKQGKYKTGRFDDALVQACVSLLRRWKPRPAPAWVTCVPSLRHPQLVPDFAARLAAALGLPFVDVLVQTKERPEQKTMANSAHQGRNLDGNIGVTPDAVLPGPVLLVDDMVDSRWTFTIAAALLRWAGSGEVWPLALSRTGKGE